MRGCMPTLHGLKVQSSVLCIEDVLRRRTKAGHEMGLKKDWARR